MSETTIGIIIGSSFTILGVMLQGFISWFLNWRTHKMTLHEQHEKGIRECAIEKKRKRELSYHDFLSTMGVYLMMFGAAKNGSACPVPVNFLDGSVLREVSNMLSSIQLHGSSKIISLSLGYVRKFFSIAVLPTSTANDIESLDVALQDVADKMKADLEQKKAVGGM
ncbi:MAG: hypothetical protein IKU71_08225 [Kiritimatiellae bacterium]|nr:hypothetical protein [Kiritimatiellia bacterium]